MTQTSRSKGRQGSRRGVEAWLADLPPLLDADGYFDWRGLTSLRDGPPLEEVNSLLCVVLSTEWVIADEAIKAQPAGWLNENPEILYREIALHELLLIAEYLSVVETFMDRENIEWFEAPGIDESQSLDGTTSASEYLVIWMSGIRDLLNRYRIWTEGALPLDEA